MDWTQIPELSVKPSFLDLALDDLARKFDIPLLELWSVQPNQDAILVAISPSADNFDKNSATISAAGDLARNLKVLAERNLPHQSNASSSLRCHYADSPALGLEHYFARGLYTCLLLPLPADPQTNSVLALWCPADRLIEAAEEHRLRQAAAGISRAIAVACRIVGQRQADIPSAASPGASFNTVLNQAAAKLSNLQDIDTYLEHIVCALAETFSADSTALFIYDAAKGTLAPKAGYFRGIVSPHLDGAHPISPSYPLRQPIMHEVPSNFESKVETFFVPEDELVLTPAVCAWHLNHGHQSVVTATVQIGATAMGFLAAAFTHRHPLGPEATQLLLALANQASVAIRLATMANAAEQRAVAEERLRLAQEIHDSLAQSFVGILMQLSAREEAVRNGSAEKTWSIVERIARHGLMEARNSVAALRLPEEDSQPLAARLSALADRFRRETSVDIHFSSHGSPFPIDNSVEFEILRIAEESLNNVVRHSRSPFACLTLDFSRSEELTVSVSDCGVGFELHRGKDRQSFGLLGMRERAERIRAKLSITSQPSLGSTVAVTLSAPRPSA